MDDPMTIIQRHHKQKFDDSMMLRTTSEVSAIIGAVTCMQTIGGTVILTWLAELEDDINAQLSHHGLFVGDVVDKQKRYQLAGFCFLYGVPLFTEDDLVEMMEQELPPDSQTPIN